MPCSYFHAGGQGARTILLHALRDAEKRGNGKGTHRNCRRGAKQRHKMPTKPCKALLLIRTSVPRLQNAAAAQERPGETEMALFKPKYITFDCYGTLTRFRMSEMARDMFADRIAAEKMDDFVRDFATYRLDEVLGAWKPYRDVLVNALHRTGKRWGIKTADEEGEAYYKAVPTWGP